MRPTEIFAEDPWDPDCLTRSPLYHGLLPERHDWIRARADWPDVAEYDALLRQADGPVLSASGRPIHFVEQVDKPDWTAFDAVYEPRTWMTGAVQTRRRNAHDWYNALVWATYPRSKAAINARHYERMLARHQAGDVNRARCPERDYLTQFDESGVAVASDDPELLDLIRQFRWKALFWERRDAARARLRFFIYGHAILEKGRAPYIGMTGRGILLQVAPGFFAMDGVSQRRELDGRLAAHFADPARFASPRLLQPVPLLGYPGWHPDNAAAAFYDDTGYFRPGRSRPATAVPGRSGAP